VHLVGFTVETKMKGGMLLSWIFVIWNQNQCNGAQILSDPVDPLSVDIPSSAFCFRDAKLVLLLSCEKQRAVVFGRL